MVTVGSLSSTFLGDYFFFLVTSVQPSSDFLGWTLAESSAAVLLMVAVVIVVVVVVVVVGAVEGQRLQSPFWDRDGIYVPAACSSNSAVFFLLPPPSSASLC